MSNKLKIYRWLHFDSAWWIFFVAAVIALLFKFSPIVLLILGFLFVLQELSSIKRQLDLLAQISVLEGILAKESREEGKESRQ
jgi:hypothetical protein